MKLKGKFKAVLIDLSGVLYVGDKTLPGSLEALAKLQESGLPHCFLTNTTRQTRAILRKQLAAQGFDIPANHLLTAASSAHQFLVKNNLRPHLLIHPALSDEFTNLETNRPNAVVVGDAGEHFNYKSLNAAFRVLMQDEATPLISMGSNRYFRESDGLSLDMGPFVSALEMASGKKALVMGKPSATFFQAGLQLLGTKPEQAVMIGDDLENDIGGAQATGIAGILVRTGKFRIEDEQQDIRPYHIVDDFSAAVELLMAGKN